jgi:hypothetical protein
VYPELNSNDIFTVTTDNQGETLDGSGIRVISFQTANGKAASGAASRFDVVS